jgi:hypothetical protein
VTGNGTYTPRTRRRKVKQVLLRPEDPVELAMMTVNPAPVNSLIYRPVDPEDPEIEELADSIKMHGLLQPIDITRDGFILSGHRRYAACSLLGWNTITGRVWDICYSDANFETLLCEFNRQRVKGFDEVVRESVVGDAKGDAYETLLATRKAKARVSGDFLVIEGVKKRKKISNGKTPMVKTVLKIIGSKEDYWPLSDREIHYDFLNEPPLRHASKPDSLYRNNRDSYQDLCDLLTRMRLVGLIPFDAIADPTRTVVNWVVDREIGGFIKRELNEFLKDYARDLQQSQPNHIEIVGEKNTIEGSIRSVAMEYCIPYTLGRGYCSLDPRHKMHERFKKSGKEKLIVLALSDFDPEGEDIAHSFARSMRDDFSIRNIVAKKVCLTYDQVLERNLPKTFDIKTGSKRYKKFAAKYGDRAHELEALQPGERARLLDAAITEVMDVAAYNREVEAEREDAKKIAALRERIAKTLAGALEQSDNGKADS